MVHSEPSTLSRSQAWLIAGGAGGAVEALVANPFLTVLTRVQLDPLGRGAWTHLRHMTLRHAFAGAPTSVGGAVARRATAYALTDRLGGAPTPGAPAPGAVWAYLGGACSGALEGASTNPIRRAMLLQQSTHHAGETRTIWQTLHYIHRHEGLAGMFRGAPLSTMRGAATSAAYFGCVSQVHRAAPELGDGSAAAIAAMAATAVGTPLDVIRARLQDKVQQSASTYQELHKLLQSDGLRGLTRGLGPNLARTVPSVAVGYWVTRKLLERLLPAGNF